MINPSNIYSKDGLIVEISKHLHALKTYAIITPNSTSFYYHDGATGSQLLASSVEDYLSKSKAEDGSSSALAELLRSKVFTDLLPQLKQADVTLCLQFGRVDVYVPEYLVQSQHKIELQKELDNFLRDRDLYFANFHGVTKSRYLAWREFQHCHGSQRCHALTKRGHQCRNYVKHGYPLPAPSKYDPTRVVYCSTHADHTMNLGTI